MSKPAGITFNRYAIIASRALRKALKQDLRVNAEKVDHLETKAARWENGKQAESEVLSVGIKKTN